MCETLKTLLLLDGWMDLSQTWAQCSPSDGAFGVCSVFGSGSGSGFYVCLKIWHFLHFFTADLIWAKLCKYVVLVNMNMCYSIFWSRPKCTFFNMSNISALNVTKSVCPLFHSLVNKPYIWNLGWLFMHDTAIGSVLKFQPPNQGWIFIHDISAFTSH